MLDSLRKRIGPKEGLEKSGESAEEIAKSLMEDFRDRVVRLPLVTLFTQGRTIFDNDVLGVARSVVEKLASLFPDREDRDHS